MSGLPPDINTLASLYGIEPREDGLLVPPQRAEDTWTSANGAAAEPITMERVREAVAAIRGPSPTGVWVDDMLEASRQSLARGRLSRMREEAQSTAARFGGAAWVDTTDEALLGGEIGVIRVVTWLASLGTEAETVLLSVRNHAPRWSALRHLVGTSQWVSLGPPLPCELHEDCRAAYRSGVAEQREMALACMESMR